MSGTSGHLRRDLGATAVAAGAGLLSGALGAVAYYDPLLRPIAHTLGLWLIVVVAVAVAAGIGLGRALRTVPATAGAALLVSVPDVLERFIRVGF